MNNKKYISGKRSFSGHVIPLGSPLGKALINSAQGREIAHKSRQAIRTGKPVTIKLKESTIKRLTR